MSTLSLSEASTADRLGRYPVFRLLPRGISFAKLNAYLALIATAAFVLAARRDGVLWIDDRPVGFLEHPAIMVFLVSQALIPCFVEKGISNFFHLHERASSILSEEMIEVRLPYHYGHFDRALMLQTKLSKSVYFILLGLGFLAFAWNSVQNQLPLRFVGTDFWDSANHPWCYGVTRLYKFYLWAVLIPAVAHAQVMLVVADKNLLLSAAKHGDLTLEPYHSDGCGGVKVFIDSVLNPMVPILLSASFLTFSAFVVHRKYDVTTIGGFLLACALFIVVYLIPVATLRRCIIMEKDRQLTSVAEVQKKFYSAVRTGDIKPAAMKEALGILGDLSSVCKQISGLPNWPQLNRVVSVVSLAASSPLIAWTVKTARGFLESAGILKLI